MREGDDSTVLIMLANAGTSETARKDGGEEVKSLFDSFYKSTRIIASLQEAPLRSWQSISCGIQVRDGDLENSNAID